MRPIEKPDFLPFKKPPEKMEDSIQAVIYLSGLEITKGSKLSTNEVYLELTGERFGIGASLQQRTIIHAVVRTTAEIIPHHISYNPEITISDLERA